MTTNCLNKNGEVKKLKIIIQCAISAIIMVVIFLNTIIGSAGSTSYAVYVDPGIGFYKVRDITAPNSNFSYENKTLKINQGDTIEWINDADDLALTIVSNQNLFTPVNIKIGKHTDYLFDRSGVFRFYIEGYSDKSQTIIVNPVGGSKNITTPVPTEVITPVPTKVIAPVPNTSAVPASNNSTENFNNSTENFNNSTENFNNSTENFNKNNGSDPQIGNLKLSNAAIPSIIVSIMSIFIMFIVRRKGR